MVWNLDVWWSVSDAWQGCCRMLDGVCNVSHEYSFQPCQGGNSKSDAETEAASDSESGVGLEPLGVFPQAWFPRCLARIEHFFCQQFCQSKIPQSYFCSWRCNIVIWCCMQCTSYDYDSLWLWLWLMTMISKSPSIQYMPCRAWRERERGYCSVTVTLSYRQTCGVRLSHIICWCSPTEVGEREQQWIVHCVQIELACGSVLSS